jgi:hypothetical protein
MSWFELRCNTCGETLMPLVATLPNELLQPDYEQCKEQTGESNCECLEEFHRRHRGHDVKEVERAA